MIQTEQTVHNLIVSLSDLSNDFDDPMKRRHIIAERHDLSLACAQLERLLRKIDEATPVNQLVVSA